MGPPVIFRWKRRVASEPEFDLGNMSDFSWHEEGERMEKLKSMRKAEKQKEILDYDLI